MSNIIVTHFNSGKLTQDLDALSTLEKYDGGCRELDNMIPDQYGNAVRRPGTTLITSSTVALCETPDENKIQIWTVQDLLDMNDNRIGDDLVGDYELMVDLDMTGVVLSDGYEAETGLISGQRGVNNNPFIGTFDGKGHTISNLTLTFPFSAVSVSGGGFFGFTNGATIQDLHLRNIFYDMTWIANNFGGLIGHCIGGSVTRCSVEGDIWFSPLDLGSNQPSMRRAGGFIGGNQLNTVGTTISKCYSKVNFTNKQTVDARVWDMVGVFAGNNVGYTISNCYAEATIKDERTTQVSATNWIGGFIGNYEGGSTSATNCWCAVPHDYTQLGGPLYNGFAEQTNGTITSSYWDQTISLLVAGRDNSDATESNTTNMRKQATFLSWDFDTIWTIDEDVDYPRLQWESSLPPDFCIPVSTNDPRFEAS